MSNIIATKTAAEDVASLLVTLSLGTIGTDLFLWKEPDTPDYCITIYDTTAHKPPEIAYRYEYSSIQVRVRRKAGDYVLGKHVVLALMNALHGYVTTVGAINYHMIRVVNGPIDLGEDERGRPRWTFNCEIHRS